MRSISTAFDFGLIGKFLEAEAELCNRLGLNDKAGMDIGWNIGLRGLGLLRMGMLGLGVPLNTDWLVDKLECQCSWEEQDRSQVCEMDIENRGFEPEGRYFHVVA